MKTVPVKTAPVVEVDAVFAVATARSPSHTRSLICKNLVELRGFEPLTPSMPWRCATSCATAP